ncbi:MAG: DUF4267 domain-containing protein [Pseudomonadota bacterium]
MGLAQASSAARAFADPQAFSVYMGLPIDGPNDAGFVTVYALRTTLIAALAFFLALTGRLGALAVIAFVALLLPIGDAWLSAQAGAPQSVVYRHIAIAVFLAFTAFMLRRDANRVSDK